VVILGVAAAAAVPGLSGCGTAATATAGDAEPEAAKAAVPRRTPYPSWSQVRSAKRFAASRLGSVSFAVIGPFRGKTKLRGRAQRTQFSSASVTKAMLLAAYLRSHKELSAEAKGLLRSMITVSDNKAAGAIYAEVGDEGLRRVAKGAGMRDFEPTPGFWGGAQITAADTARFFFRLEDNLGKRHQRFGMKLLASIVSFERWGIPDGAGDGWSVWFKGGWRPGGGDHSSGAVSHQAALLRFRDGTRIAIAVLTNETPGDAEGYGTIEGIASRLTHPAPTSFSGARP
jgi:beta-lactamase class A